MPRRILALLLGILAVAVLPGLSRDSDAQTPARVYRIGYLETGVRPSNPARYAERFREALGALGYVEGRHYVMEYRFAEGQRDRLPDLAAELVQMPVDLVLAASTPAALAAKQATTTIPVVFTVSADPVERGLVQSLGRPGGNVTGFTNGIYEEKRLEVLKEAVPAMTRCGWLCECPSKTVPGRCQDYRRGHPLSPGDGPPGLRTRLRRGQELGRRRDGGDRQAVDQRRGPPAGGGAGDDPPLPAIGPDAEVRGVRRPPLLRSAARARRESARRQWSIASSRAPGRRTFPSSNRPSSS